MRRIAMMAAAALAIWAADSTPSAAQNAPWCLRIVLGGPATDLCYYRTFEECNQERFGWGPTAHCIPGPGYRHAEPAPPGARRGGGR